MKFKNPPGFIGSTMFTGEVLRFVSACTDSGEPSCEARYRDLERADYGTSLVISTSFPMYWPQELVMLPSSFMLLFESKSPGNNYEIWPFSLNFKQWEDYRPRGPTVIISRNFGYGEELFRSIGPGHSADHQQLIYEYLLSCRSKEAVDRLFSSMYGASRLV